MKILQIVGEIDGGGVGQVVYNYLSHMDLSDAKFDILAFEKEGNKEQLLEKDFSDIGCEVIYIKHRNLGYLKHFSLYRKLLRENRYDIVHCHFGLWSTIYLLLACLEGVNCRIAHSHIAKDEYGFPKQLLLNMTKPLLNLFTTERYACGRDAGKYLWGSKTYTILNNAIELEKFRYNNDLRLIARKKLNIDKDTILLGHIGRFSFQKNQEFIVNIVKKMVSMGLNIRLVFIGNGENIEKVKKMVSNEHLEKYILFLGLRDDVNELIQAMDIFLLPSRYEGLPVVGIEAQCTGINCIFSSNITDEVMILPNSIMLPIEPMSSCVDLWVDEIKKQIVDKTRTINRELGIKYIKEHGFDIYEEARKLKENYRSYIKWRG